MEPQLLARIDSSIAADIERLFSLTHPDPHSILGAHRRADGVVVVRALRPDAARIRLLVDGEEPRAMERRGNSGLFEIVLDGRRDLFPYQLEITKRGDSVEVIRDPYCFLPTLGELDIHLMAEQSHERPYAFMGAHVRDLGGVAGVAFAVWAPNARGVSVVSDFNGWDGRMHMMRMLGGSGIWELFIPGAPVGARYKYEIRTHGGALILKTDPYATATEVPPATAAVVNESHYQFGDAQWMEARAGWKAVAAPFSVYEMHLGSWRRVVEDGNRPMTYRELAPVLADYLADLGFTHVELMPVMEHPFGGSWGYEVTGYFAPTARYGSPDDFRFFVDHLHKRGIGVILDWVPAHFPTDAFALARFDGTALYEHADPRQGYHQEWGTLIFNYGRTEVRTFLEGNAQFWIHEFHADGLRVDAVASMLYLDYGRGGHEWIPNRYGGRENLEAIDFIKSLNEHVYARNPGVTMIAEESTSFAGVSRPTSSGGIGFGFKWDMGWMHDTLNYFAEDPINRKWHHRNLTFGMLYVWNENFVLPLSHDEVVYGKRSLLAKMPGDRWQQFANLRSLFGYMWARPGKKVLFMGGEFGQWNEWNHDQSLDWHLLAEPDHRGMQTLMRDLNNLYRAEPALWQADSEPAGFLWIAPDNADDNVLAFIRIAPSSGRMVVCLCNFSPVMRQGYRFGVPRPGWYREILNTDSAAYGGSNVGNAGAAMAEDLHAHGFPHSISVVLPPLAVLWFAAPGS